MFEPVLSTTVLDEIERALLVRFPHLDPAAAHSRVAAMRDALEDHLVDGQPADAPEQVNAKDRHVVAAAVQGEAVLLVTNDGRLRGEIDRALPRLRALSLDDFALELWHRSPEGTCGVVDALVAKRTRPPITRDALLQALAGAAPTFVDRLR